jgi:hypothetical protein
MVLKSLKPVSSVPFLWQLANAMVDANKNCQIYSWDDYVVIMTKRSRLSDESVAVLKRNISSLVPNAFPVMPIMPEDLDASRLS